MKKLLTITITIILMVPQDCFALRPMAEAISQQTYPIGMPSQKRVEQVDVAIRSGSPYVNILNLKIKVPPGHYIIPESNILDKDDNFNEQYDYLVGQVSIAKKKGLIPLLATMNHHPSLALTKAVEYVYKVRPKIVSIDQHPDIYLTIPRASYNILYFWRYGIEEHMISGEDLILAVKSLSDLFEELKQKGISEELIQLAREIPIEHFLTGEALSIINPRYKKFVRRYKLHKVSEVDLPILLYMLKTGIAVSRPVLDGGLLAPGRPVLVSFDTDANLNDQQVQENSEVLGKHEIVAVHLSGYPGANIHAQAITEFLRKIVAASDSVSRPKKQDILRGILDQSETDENSRPKGLDIIPKEQLISTINSAA